METQPSLTEDAPGISTQTSDQPVAGTEMTYAPTLLIGLGGTGAEVLLRVKKQLRARGLEENGLHRFLFIDTDLDTFAKKQGLPEVEEREKCLIGVDNVDDFLGHPELYPALKDRFPEEELGRAYLHELSNGRGASQIRSLGAFALALDAESVRNRIERAYEDLIDLTDRIETRRQERGAEVRDQVYIYLVGSLAGGTGSGCFLDVALLSKDVCDPWNPKLVGMFALPRAFDELFDDPEQEINTRANTYAALKELQFCLDADRKERKELGSISYRYDSLEHDLELGPSNRLFDLCFLVNDRSKKGKLSTIEDLYSLMGRTILQDVGSPFGANANSFESNASVLTDAVCPKTDLPRRFGTISTSALVYPASRVADYCTFRSAGAVVEDQLIGSPPSEETLRERLSDFLEGHSLDDRGASNQILESLLQADNPRSLDPAPEDGDLISSDWFDLRYDFGEDLSGEEFARRIRDEWSRFSNDTISDIADVVDQNRKYRLAEVDADESRSLRSIVEELALSTAAEHGAEGAREMLDMLEDVVEEMRAEFREETESWEDREEWLVQEFEETADELAQMGTIKEFFTSQDDDLKKQLIELYGNYVEGSLWATARPGALQVLEKLLAEARDVGSNWGQLITKFTQLRKKLRREANKLETHQRQQGFVVEQEVTLPGYEERYYKRNRLNSGEALDVVLGSYEDSGESRTQLFREALRRGPMSFGEGALLGPLYDHFSPPLSNTNIVNFVENNPEEVEEDSDQDVLKHKLEDQSALCQPFWPAKPVGPIIFPEYKGISLTPDKIQDGDPVYSSTISEWCNVYEYNDIPSPNQREIVLSRRTYGARAFYLSPCENWKENYKVRQDTSEGKYMTETHIELKNIPDLFPPDDIRPLRYFAIGIALGFIVQRGDWYYFGLEKPPYGYSDTIRVLYKEQDWPSIHSLDASSSPPSKTGKLDFTQREADVDKQRHQLAQGRENAIEALSEEEDYIDLLEGAINEYHQSVGNKTFTEQLYTYSEDVLRPKASGSNIFARELRQIEKRLHEIGK